jgi:hypothetical protein
MQRDIPGGRRQSWRWVSRVRASSTMRDRLGEREIESEMRAFDLRD